MLVAEPRSLLRKLNATCTRALEDAASACIASRHYEVAVEHVLLALLDKPNSDIATIFEHYRLDLTHARATLQRAVGDLRSGNSGKPVFSTLLFEWVQDAWLYASTELGEEAVRSGALLVRLLVSPMKYLPTELPLLEQLPREELRKDLAVIAGTSGEAAERAAGAAARSPGATAGGAAGADAGRSTKGAATALGAPDGPLARFTTDLTQRAKDGLLDPVLGREAEIRQVVDILARRRKNNPIIVGEPGVGKTALVEGLALRIAEGSVPGAAEEDGRSSSSTSARCKPAPV